MAAQTEQINNTREISLFFLYHVTCAVYHVTCENQRLSSMYTTEYLYYESRISR